MIRHCTFPLTLVFLLFGCAARPLYTQGNVRGETEFERKLAYSRNLFSKPIDILEADSAHALTQLSDSSASSGSGGDSHTQLLPGRKGAFAVQLAAFKSRENAGNSRDHAQKQYPDLPVSIHQHLGYWRVIIGFYQDRDVVEQILQRLRSQGKQDAWIIKP